MTAMQSAPDHDAEIDAELARLRASFPQFRIWRETTFDRPRYVARSQNLGTRPHTLVTSDLGELAAALTVGLAEPNSDQDQPIDAATHSTAGIARRA
jgi:hypothetical protein